MSTYRLWPTTNGGALVSFSGSFIAGTTFQVVPGVKWLDGYWWWVPTGGDTGAQKFATWVESSNTTGQVVSGSVVTSGTLSATPTGGESGGHWNFVPLPISIPLAPGTAYIAATGWTAVHGFPDTGGYWSSGGGGQNGIVNGPLIAFSSATSGGLSNVAPWAGGQGVFSTAGTDPSLVEPLSQSGSDNFWVDVQVNDSPAATYAGTYRLWPNNTVGNPSVAVDASVNYGVAVEFSLSQAAALNKIWYYSPPTATQLATAASIWSVTGGGLSGTKVAGTSSPTWSGAVGSGWISCSFSGVVLPPGDYKVSVYNGAATPAGAFAKDSQTDPWRNGALASGITSGPLSAPGLSTASLAFNYNNNPAGTPPFSDGTTLAGQSTFFQNTGGSDGYPYLYAPVATPTAGSTQNYFVDVEVTPIPADASEPPQVPRGLLERLLLAAPRRWSTDAPATIITQGAATLTASASVAAPAAQDSGAILGGAAAVAAPDATQRAGASLAGGASLALPAAQEAGGALVGAASVTAPSAQQAGAVLSGQGSLGTAETQQAGTTLDAAASLAGAGTQEAASSLSASGSLTAPSAQRAPASLTGQAAFGSAATAQTAGTLAGDAAVAAPPAQFAGATLDATASILASPGGESSGAAALAASGGISAPGRTGSAATAAGAASVTAGGEQEAAAALAATGQATGPGEQEMGTSLDAQASVTATTSEGQDQSGGFFGVFP